MPPFLRVPFRTSKVEVMPRLGSRWASITTPSADLTGSALRSSSSATKSIISRSESILVPVLALISTDGVLPPYDSTSIFSSASCCFTRSKFISGLSTLFMATISWRLFSCAMEMASLVWGFTPSSAATTKIAISATLAPRERILEKASCPGVSIKVIFLCPSVAFGEGGLPASIW